MTGKESNTTSMDRMCSNDSLKECDSNITQKRDHNLYMFVHKSDILLVSGAIFTAIIASAASSGMSILSGCVFQVLSDFQAGSYRNFEQYDIAIKYYSFGIVGLGVSVLLIIWINTSLWMKLGELQQLRLRRLLYLSLHNRPLAWFEANPQLNGDLVQVNRCIEEHRVAVSECTGALLEAVCSLVGLAITCFFYSWRLTLVIVASAPIIMLVVWFFNSRVQQYISLENDYSADATKIVDFNLCNPTFVKLLNTEKLEYTKFIQSNNRARNAFNRACLFFAAQNGLLRILVLMVFVSAFWFGSFLVKRGTETSGDIITTFMASLLLADSVRDLTDKFIHIQKGRVALSKVLGFIGDEALQKKASPATEVETKAYPSSCRGEIVFESIEFYYPSRPSGKILSDLSLYIPEGTFLFLVGESGSGKSTLATLLLNIYKPEKGNVSIDGYKVSELSDLWLTDNITLVQQNSYLFNEDIRTNIALGMAFKQDPETVSDSRIKDSTQFALLQLALLDFPDGLFTVVGQKGKCLSGGQAQKVALAVARLRDTPILILDESLSALDTIQRKLMIAAIKKWRKGKTTIMMTHDYNQIGVEDYVCVIKNQKVDQIGRKAELIQSGVIPSDKCLQIAERARNFDKFQFELIDSKSVHSDETDWEEATPVIKDFISRFSVFTERHLSESNKKRRRKHASGATSTPTAEVDSAERPKVLLSIWNCFFKFKNSFGSKTVISLGILSAIINGAANPAFSYCFSKLLAAITTADKSDHYIQTWALIVIGITVADGITTFLKTFLLGYSAEAWVNQIRASVFNIIINQKMTWHNAGKYEPSELSALLLNDTRDLKDLVSDFLEMLFTVAVMVIAGLVWSIAIGWKMALVGTSFLPLFAVVYAAYSRILGKKETLYKTRVAELENHIHDTVDGITSIQLYRMSSFFNKKFRNLVNQLKCSGTQRAVSAGAGIGISQLMLYASRGIILYYGMHLVGKGEYSVSQLVEVLTLMIFSISSAASIVSQIPDISRAKRAATYLSKICQECSKDFEEEGGFAPYLDYWEKKIEAKSLSFSYSTRGGYALRNLNFQVTKNEVFGIVGESGSGKSTLASLLMKLYPVDGLNIWGTEVNNISTDYLRRNITIVSQNARFFDGTIRQNLTYGLEEQVKAHDIEEALKAANIYDWVVGLTAGLETIINVDTTSMISGGQAQRLSLARSILRKPNILILDEVTSALDPKNAKDIRELISTRLRFMNMTIIIITHHREMMEILDRMIVLKAGAISEEGSYHSLMQNERSELYRILNRATER